MHRRDDPDTDPDPDPDRVYTECGRSGREGSPQIYARLAKRSRADQAREMRQQGIRDERPARECRLNDSPPAGKGDRLSW
ncbi:hypothetical protein [Plantibacter sp. ME-Dv--P-095]|uniref:hypothetical protein n=1 Tax=Plantibacter sp. ME-Dv--P-095 TaxID=3040299 RepID=UPI00254BCAE3|nr:hypothetical protein [Plantibacter sp. ME-Dv--P-095]